MDDVAERISAAICCPQERTRSSSKFNQAVCGVPDSVSPASSNPLKIGNVIARASSIPVDQLIQEGTAWLRLATLQDNG